MATQDNITTNVKQSDDFIRVRDLLNICIAKWYWFVISLAITIGVAIIYILSTPPVYTRSASLLIKEDGKNGSAVDAGVLSEIDIFQTSTNVNNEIQLLQSPSVMLDVVKRLHLDVNYHADGRFYRRTLYGSTCPYTVEFTDLGDNDIVTFTIDSQDGNNLTLNEFTFNGEEFDGETNAVIGDTVATPIGRLVVKPTIIDTTALSSVVSPIYVTRNGLLSTTRAYTSGLTVALSNDKSSVINLTFNDVCIQRAEDILNTVIAVYNENWIKDRNQVAVSTSMFINERLGVIERELGNVDESISSFKSENLLPDVQAAANMYMSQSSTTTAQILALNTQLSMARYIRSYVTNANGRNQLLPANSGIENANIESQIAEYNSMQLQRNSLVANSSEQNPLVQDLDQSLNAMREAIVSSIDNLMVVLNTQLNSLQQSERQTTARIAANPSQGKYLLSVERQQKVKESLYLFLLQKREENELSQAFTAYNTRIITPPTGSPIPTSPEKKNIFLVAIALGLIIPFGTLFAKENMNTKLRGRKDLESLTLPFAGEIPLVTSKGKKQQENNKIVIEQGHRDVVNEAFRVLRTNMEFMLGDTSENGKAPVILFTSFNPGSGKTFLAVNTAACIAIKGKRVLVIDGDLRRGSASAYIDKPQSGLSDYLGHRTNDIASITVEVENHPTLHIIPVGTIPPNPTELLADKRFNQLIEDVRTKYDYIFIDCPPIDIVADTQIISKIADRTIFIVRAGLLEREMLPELQRMYDEHRFNNMALVLNGTEATHSRYAYRYGYYNSHSNNYYK